MATSSFSKDFTLSSKKSVDSFVKIMNSSSEDLKIEKSLVSTEKERRGELKLRKMLSR